MPATNGQAVSVGSLPIAMNLGWVWGGERADVVHHSVSFYSLATPFAYETASTAGTHHAGTDTDRCVSVRVADQHAHRLFCRRCCQHAATSELNEAQREAASHLRQVDTGCDDTGVDDAVALLV